MDFICKMLRKSCADYRVTNLPSDPPIPYEIWVGIDDTDTVICDGLDGENCDRKTCGALETLDDRNRCIVHPQLRFIFDEDGTFKNFRVGMSVMGFSR